MTASQPSQDPLLIAYVEDEIGMQSLVEYFLHGDPQLETAEVIPYETVHSFLYDLEDPDFEIDLLLVDLVTQSGDYGGLKGLAALSQHRPGVPAVVYSAIQNSDRFMYALAAAAWFGGPEGPLRAIVPKRLGAGSTQRVGPQFAAIIRDVLEGTHGDELLNFLRDADRAEPFFMPSFHELLRSRSDLERWLAVMRQPQIATAARQVGISEPTLRGWLSDRLDRLGDLWETIAEDWDEHHPGLEIVGPLKGQLGEGSPFNRAQSFTTMQRAFFTDPYLKEHFPAE